MGIKTCGRGLSVERTNGAGRTAVGLVFLLCTMVPLISSAQTFASLVSFDNSNDDIPLSIIQGPDGRLWGTSANGKQNCGEIFRVTPKGRLSVYAFNCSDGNGPGNLTLGMDGNFYGSTSGGGTGNGGTIFKLTPHGVVTVLYNFAEQGATGSAPVGNLAQGADGNFYGATYGGGSSLGYGTLFKITPEGSLTTLYTFDFTHGANPFSGMIEGLDGNFYGTTYSGGSASGGTVYKITTSGVLTVLYNFGMNSQDPTGPFYPLMLGRDGNFYGSTFNGGPNNDGAVYAVTPRGSFTTLHTFTGSDGQSPAALVQATDGNIYGSTLFGGPNSPDGTIFKMTTAGNITTLHNFDGNDGANPTFLVQDTNGALIGITGGGGNLSCNPPSGCGTVYSLGLGLHPFVQPIPTAGAVGTKVTVLGTNLTGATGVSFNGVAAGFTVVSSSEITTTVPTGAATGRIKVTTPSRTFSSNVPFRVRK